MKKKSLGTGAQSMHPIRRGSVSSPAKKDPIMLPEMIGTPMVEIPMVEVPLYKNSNIPSSMQGDDAPEFQTEEDEIEYGILHRDFMAFNK